MARSRRAEEHAASSIPAWPHEHLYPASQLLASLIAFGPQPTQGHRGGNALSRTKRAIHQDGYLKERQHLRDHGPALGGSSGEPADPGQAQRAARAEPALREPGYTLSKAELDGVYGALQSRMADRKKGVLNEGDCGDSRRAPGGRGRGGIALGA